MVVSASGGMLIDGSATLTLSTAYQVRAFKFAGPKWI
jgi:hypothetical protein